MNVFSQLEPIYLSTLTVPTVLIGGLLLLAATTYVLRTWERIVALCAAAIAALLALWVWQLDLTDPMRTLGPLPIEYNLSDPLQRLGFTLRLQPGAVPILVASLGLTAFAFVLSAHISQGRSFVPFTLLLLAGYITLALLTGGLLDAPLIAPLILAALSCLSVFALQAGRRTIPAGPLRTLVPPLLAFPLFLLAAWYINEIPLNPQDSSAAGTAAQLLALGLLLLLAPVPLHSAQPATAQSAPPVVSALLTLLYQLALLHLIVRVIDTYPFIVTEAPLDSWFRLAGLITAVWGGIAAAGTNHPGRLWGYAALHDWGLILLVLAVPGNPSWPLVLLLFGLRAVSMLTAAAGLAVIAQKAGGLGIDQLNGIGSRLPWNSAAFLLGGLGLTGFPLTAGFTGHWAALQLLAEIDWRPAAVVLIASGATVFGFVRMARTLFSGSIQRPFLHEGPVSLIFAVGAILLSACLAFAPQLLNGPIERALIAFG